jgi:hypothetical protein
MKRIKKLLMPLLEWALLGEFDAALIEMGRNNELYDYFVLKHMHSDDKGFMVLCDRNYTAMHTHMQWSVHLSALLIT